MDRPTFSRSPRDPLCCNRCGKGEGAHVWICDECGALLDCDARGLPRRLCHAGAWLVCAPESEVCRPGDAPPTAQTERPPPEPPASRPVTPRTAPGFAPLPGAPLPHQAFHQAVGEVEKAAAGVWDLLTGNEDPGSRIARYILGGKR